MSKTILDTITEHKRMEVLKRKGRKPLEALKKKPLYDRIPLDPAGFFDRSRPCIIAEYKRKSPSKGVLSASINPVPVVHAYKEGGASAASILTDRDFFGGSFRDLEHVKNAGVDLPLLRKDFMIDPYQVHEAKAYGADIILLIAAILNRQQVRDMTALATSLGLSVLLEVHGENELDHWVPGIGMVGVNNRNLRTFEVDMQRSVDLASKLPGEALKVSESGLHEPKDVLNLFKEGYNGFLMGEHFMKAEDPGKALHEFMKHLNNE
jgi:indole-3-glycerol phosphate synthase